MNVDHLVMASVLTGDPAPLARAERLAARTRDRQLVALARAWFEPEPDRFDALVRDHLVDHPDDVLAAWIAGRTRPDTTQEN